MASWMIHLRVAEKLISKLHIENEREFIVGNIAPDSGEPNEDMTYTPSGMISHFRIPNPEGAKIIDEQRYIATYFTGERQEGYGRAEQEFYLGYLTHLLTDKLWTRDIYEPAKRLFGELYVQDKSAFVKKVKRDWYDLDALYLKKYPDFRAFRIYQSCEGFVNHYLDFFSEQAFDNRRKFIVDFYLTNSQTVQDREMYLDRQEIEDFVERAVEEICEEVEQYIVKK